MTRQTLVVILEDPFTTVPFERGANEEFPQIEIFVNEKRVMKGKPTIQGNAKTHMSFGEVTGNVNANSSKVTLTITINDRGLQQTETVDLPQGRYLYLTYDRKANRAAIAQRKQRLLYR